MTACWSRHGELTHVDLLHLVNERAQDASPGWSTDLNSPKRLTTPTLPCWTILTSVWRALQRGVDRGELRADIDFAFVSDLHIGPLFIRSIVWGQSLEPSMAKRTVEVVMAAFSS